MWSMALPVLIVVVANTLYNICTKQTPENVNTFAALIMTYFVSMVSAMALFFLTRDGESLVTELQKTNWSTWLLGMAIVGVEFGYIYMYRVGWKLSLGSMAVNLVLACVLLIIGYLFFKETLTPRQMVGFVVCLLGIFLIAK